MLFLSLGNVPESEVPRPLESGCTGALMLSCSSALPHHLSSACYPREFGHNVSGRARGCTPGTCAHTGSSTVPASPALVGGKGLRGKGLSLLCGGSPGRVAAYRQLPPEGSPSPQPTGPGSGSAAQPRGSAWCICLRRSLAGAWPVVSTPWHTEKGSVFDPGKHDQLPNSALQGGQRDQHKPGVR